MMIPDHYEINVSRPTAKCPNGEYFCRIEIDDSLILPQIAEERCRILREIFPDEFKLDMTRVRCYGEHIEMEDKE